jgi:hypothetical protein
VLTSVLPATERPIPQQAANRRQLSGEIDDAIVSALVAAIVASFRREPPSTVGSRRGTDRGLMVAS